MIAASFVLCAMAIPQSGFTMVPEGSVREPRALRQPGQMPVERMIVKMRDRRGENVALSAVTVQGLSARSGVTLAHVRPMSGGAHVMALQQKMNVVEAWTLAEQLMKDPDVEYAEPDRWMQIQLVPDPNDASYASQWHYHSPAVSAGGANIREAWNTTTGVAGITLAVIDTGLRPHADIATNILDGSGRVVPGYDFISSPTIGVDGDGRDADPTDPGDWSAAGECFAGATARNSSWHGTHVAGTIGALSNNSVGVTGINWASKILPVRALGKCGGTVSDIADGIRWAAGLAVVGAPVNANPARVINLSIGGGGPCGVTYQSAIDAVVAVNTVVVVAAGNSNTDALNSAPANCNNVVTVASTGRTGARAAYSNYGSIIKIAAPGGDMASATTDGILSTLNAGTQGPAADSYSYYQGTSMATPHVVGIVSLMLSVNPALTPAQVLAILQGSARPFPTGTIRDCTTSICGPGIIDAAAALTASDPAFPGFMQFTASTAIVSEPTGSITVSVARVAGAIGAASVNYSTANGTATAGSDYTASTGTLNWAHGDSTTRTITIPLNNDGIAEGNETFSISLASPSGAALGSIRTMVITIADPDTFPLGGIFPSGWTTSAGANAGWAVANDASFEGIFSLKSAPIAHGQKAQVEITKVFQAGQVSFARRVSSELNYDYLRFYIDGVQQGLWSGEAAWSNVSFPLSEGSHTLRWSYEKDAVCCVSGSDAAWIDAVSLPAQLIAPGNLQFTASTATVIEPAGSVTVSVARTSGATGSVSVSYLTSNGTASAGTDYTTSGGILTWADGDSTVKTITIPVANDGVAEGNETFSVTLGSPSGGATLGSISTIVVTILDNDVFPPSAAVPAGWTTSAGANAGWAVASDSSSEGALSLKSGPIGHSQKAQVEVTRMFQAGQVSFDRRVSSETNYDYLRFYIDGILQGAWSGNVVWSSVSFPIAAGSHTLRWSYEKDSSVVVGSDAAWIDVVTMPLITPPDAPVISALAPGPGRITVNFNATVNNGGDAIVSYTASCSAPGRATASATRSSSPIVVPGLIAGVAYSCFVVASNSAGSGAASTPMTATPGRLNGLTPILMLLLD